MLSGLRGSVTDLVIYFSAWSVVFSVYAIWHGRRLIYLLALYLALIGFDVIWRGRAPDDCIPLAPWIALVGEGCVAFLISSNRPSGASPSIMDHTPNSRHTSRRLEAKPR